MAEYCLKNEPVEPFQIYLGFAIFVIFFLIIFYCQKSGRKRTRIGPSHSQISMEKRKKNKAYRFKACGKEQFEQNSVSKEEEEESKKISAQSACQSGVRKSKLPSMEATWSRLSGLVYNYAKNQHEMFKVYRGESQIKMERELYLTRQIKIVSNAQQKANIKPFKSFPEPPRTIKNHESMFVDHMPMQEEDSNKNCVPKEELANNNGKSTIETKCSPVLLNDSKETSKLPQLKEHTPILPIDNRIKEQPSVGLKQKTIQQPTMAGESIEQAKEPAPKKQELFPSLDKKKQRVEPSKKEAVAAPKLQSSMEYLKAIIKYSQSFSVRAEISTNISNLNGARSDPKQLWLFASSYIKTINPGNHDEVVTFSYRIWDAVVNKFIKNTNIKDGFEKIPPMERNKQVEKNSIITYVMLINIFRVMGFEAVWLGIFGKTLNMLSFLFLRKEPIRDWKKLELLEMKYLTLEGDISSKYQSRIDFLTYFLITLTTIDPVEALEEISGKTGENYPFIDQLRKHKHKWSYREFWCLVDCMKNNTMEAYFRIPFWCNVLSAIYLQMLSSIRQGKMSEFEALSVWVIKEIKLLTNKHEKTPETKYLEDQLDEHESGKYEFDGEEFVNSIKALGRSIDTKEREIKLTTRDSRWEDFRDKFSILYYFWRRDT